jgi:predicted ATPase/DNA-binding CsgD family transcriptional regulator
VGRAREAGELTGLLERHRLVTVTGPGGVGKTRLAAEVARRSAGGFPDGVWFIELGATADAAQVTAQVTAALGVQQGQGRSPLEVLADALAPRRLLLVLDNCEHVRSAAAELCGILLTAADDVRILATSREQLWVHGEARYRLKPLDLPRSDQPEETSQSAAVALFRERARQADPAFSLLPEDTPLVSHVVARLDGMPLAIELAAARVEALGLAGLAERIDDALRLLGGKDRPAAARHRSLTAVADWSYQLLSGTEQRVFRRLAAFPGPFTLEAAESVAGSEAGPVVLRLVDCSLLTPPQSGPDQRTRYTMLQTLRAYGLDLLAGSGDEQATLAALAGFALSVAGQAAAGLASTEGELEALRWLDAEDATLNRALSWLHDHDQPGALRLATKLAPWWRVRGRLAEAVSQLNAAAQDAAPDWEDWARAQVWLGYLSENHVDSAGSIAHCTAVCEAGPGQQPLPQVVDALAARAISHLNLGDVPRAADDARSALALANDIGYPAGQAEALTSLSLTAYYTGGAAEALDWARQAEESLSADLPGYVARWSRMILGLVLSDCGELDAARRVCADGLAQSRQAGDLANLASLLVAAVNAQTRAGSMADAAAHLEEAVAVSSRIGDHTSLSNGIDQCGYLCAATGRWAEAVTLWAALAADRKRLGLATISVYDRRRPEFMRQVERALEPAQVREADERGARMTFAAAVELVTMLAAAAPPEPRSVRASGQLSARERELVTLVAHGRTNAEIAAELFISIRTVGSHLDRIRDKTGYRRRADLTRLALSEGLV